MKIACAQVATVDGADAVAANLDRCYAVAERAVGAGAELVALPELASTGYCTDDYAPLIEPLDGPVIAKFQQIAARGPAQIVVGLVIADDEGRPLNGAVVVGPNGAEGMYGKTHLCVNDLPQTDESSRFAAGSSLGLFEAPAGRVGVMICYDGHHPELARALTLEGAEVLVWINNRSSIERWEAAATAKFNMVPVALVNRVGEAGRQPPDAPPRLYPGRSAICDHAGTVLAQVGDGEEALVAADIDLVTARHRRHTDPSLNTIESRRLDLYAKTLARPPAWSRGSGG